MNANGLSIVAVVGDAVVFEGSPSTGVGAGGTLGIRSSSTSSTSRVYLGVNF